MTHQQTKDLFLSAVADVTANISQYAVSPGKDFSRNRKIPPETLIRFLVSQGSSSERVEMLDFWELDASMPTLSAFNQQRAKLRPAALENVFRSFSSCVAQCPDFPESDQDYRFIAADGSTATYSSFPRFSPEEYFCAPGKSLNGVYSIHINAFFDLDAHIYTDALLQPVRKKNEFGAFCSIVDRHGTLPGKKNVYIGDRGYCSYNNMAHVMEQGQYFLFRTKDIHSKGLVRDFDFPDSDSFDMDVRVTLTRSHSKKVQPIPDTYVRFIGKDQAFDFVERGSLNTYLMGFRIVRFPLENGTFECLVTNLPRDEFPPDKLKGLYYRRWGIESSFRKLKYTIGLSNFHSCRPDYVEQEIWANLIAYNITETMVNNTIIQQKEGHKHTYKVNFTVAAHICRAFLRPSMKKDPDTVMMLLRKELIPIRDGRHYKRLQTAHFRRPRYFIYRAA